jgi:hypothetical protein
MALPGVARLEFCCGFLLKTKNNSVFVCKVVQNRISLHSVLSKYQKNKQKNI